uniref:Uncharacterized protein n=1 Tax=Rhizophora mucronata TaxID=61149 RepID=A0A2P2Q282_RHIMU
MVKSVKALKSLFKTG